MSCQSISGPIMAGLSLALAEITTSRPMQWLMRALHFWTALHHPWGSNIGTACWGHHHLQMCLRCHHRKPTLPGWKHHPTGEGHSEELHRQTTEVAVTGHSAKGTDLEFRVVMKSCQRFKAQSAGLDAFFCGPPPCTLYTHKCIHSENCAHFSAKRVCCIRWPPFLL